MVTNASWLHICMHHVSRVICVICHLSDTERARGYEVEITEWYVPLGVYTEGVDYLDVAVQVSTRLCSYCRMIFETERRADDILST